MNYHMDLLEAAKDTIEQFDIKKVAKNLVNFAANRRVAQGLSKQDKTLTIESAVYVRRQVGLEIKFSFTHLVEFS